MLAISLSAVGMRLLAYVGKTRPPLSILGRLFNGYLLIPGYDVVFIAPAAALVSSVAIFGATRLCGFDLPVAMTLAITMLFAIVLHVGPTRRAWELTGHHRLVFRPAQQTRR